ncbi:MAG: ABC transporter permease [Mesorhizobium amorphae]|nr:MAG: ABC transporter permease [Mesorhizobium amorphae]
MSAVPLEASPRRRRTVPVPLVLFVGASLLYVVTALVTGQGAALTGEGISGLLGRMPGLGLVALGQTFAILVGSIDLSVANLISVSAVLASFIMQGDPAMMLPAVLAVLAVAALVGCVNGLIVTRLGVNPLIATLGVGLILQGLLSASFDNFAGAVPPVFQQFAYGTVLGLPMPVVFLLMLAVLAAWVLRSTRFGAHIYAVGGSPDGARLAGIRTARIIMAAHVISSVSAGLTGLYLASRLRSGAPWVGRDGIYDLESIAVVVIGGTLLAGGRGGVWGTLAGVFLFAVLDAVFNMAGVDAFAKQVLRGAIVVAAVAVYTVRMKGHVA